MMRNLYDETVARLFDYGKSIEDIGCVTVLDNGIGDSLSIRWSQFAKIAKGINYDPECPKTLIALSLRINGKKNDWYMYRVGRDEAMLKTEHWAMAIKNKKYVTEFGLDPYNLLEDTPNEETKKYLKMDKN